MTIFRTRCRLSRPRTACAFAQVIAVVAGVATSVHLTAGEGGPPPASPDFPFAKGVLLERFDADRDGRLVGNEKQTLRQAFGGVDVPILPERPFDYTQGDRPEYVASETHRDSDNTPPHNPTTNQGAALGRVLFYDKQLSKNNTVACASCHSQQRGFADPRLGPGRPMRV